MTGEDVTVTEFLVIVVAAVGLGILGVGLIGWLTDYGHGWFGRRPPIDRDRDDRW